MRVIAQRLGSVKIFQQVLLDLLQDPLVVRCRALIAFATLDGLVRIGAEPGGILDTFISDRTKQLHWVVGIDAVTTAEALSCLKRLQDNSGGRCIVRAFSSNAGSLFHPKLFIFEKANGSGHVLIGSNNLTPGGLESNTEVAVLLEDLPASEFADWEAVWNQADGMQNALLEINDSLIHRIENDRKRDIRRRRRVVMREEEELEPSEVGIRVLVRYVAKAGGRTSQVHFSIGKVREFFHLTPGDTTEISLQMVQPGEPLGRIERGRRLVFSQINRNARIEMEGLRNKLPSDYPAGGRAILVVQEVESNHYRYMALLPDDAGYNELRDHLDSIPQQGPALKEDILTLGRLVEIWPDYPV
jgi:hypothetical protein